MAVDAAYDTAPATIGAPTPPPSPPAKAPPKAPPAKLAPAWTTPANAICSTEAPDMYIVVEFHAIRTTVPTTHAASAPTAHAPPTAIPAKMLNAVRPSKVKYPVGSV